MLLLGNRLCANKTRLWSVQNSSQKNKQTNKKNQPVSAWGISSRHKLVTWNTVSHTLAHINTHTGGSYTFVAHFFLAEKNKKQNKKKSAGLCWLSCTILWHLISAMHLYKITVVYNILYFKCCIYWLREEKTSFLWISPVCIKINKGPITATVQRIGSIKNRSGTTLLSLFSDVLVGILLTLRHNEHPGYGVPAGFCWQRA